MSLGLVGTTDFARFSGFVGESFSSAMRGRSSPGPASVSDSLFSDVDVVVDTVVGAVVIMAAGVDVRIASLVVAVSLGSCADGAGGVSRIDGTSG